MNAESRIDWKNNSIDLIKMIAAISVALVHWTKVGIVENPGQLMGGLRQIFLAIPSVIIFFVLSGYLAAASVNKYNKKDYIINRILRIYPPLWISIVVNIIVLIIMWWDRIDRTLVLGVFAEFFGIAYTPACLKELPTGSMSGALWTVMVQIQFYILICLVNPILNKLNVQKWYYLLVTLLIINVICRIIPSQGIIGKIIERTVFPYLVWFMFGVFSFKFFYRLILLYKRITLPSICVMFIYIILGRPLNNIGYYADIIITLCTLPMTIGLIYMFGKIRIKREFSFSIFLYHWIILNVFSILGLYKKLGVFEGMLLYLLVVLIVSYLMNDISNRFGKNIINFVKYRKEEI